MPEDVDKLVAAINVVVAQTPDAAADFRKNSVAALGRSDLEASLAVLASLSSKPLLECCAFSLFVGMEVGKAIAEAERLEAMLEAQ